MNPPDGHSRRWRTRYPDYQRGDPVTLPALASALAAAALALTDLCQRRGWELDRAGTSGIYVATRRAGTAVHVTAGSAAEVLEALTDPGRPGEDSAVD